MTDNTGFAAFALWNALRLHFTSDSYNYFKYNGKTNVSQQTFMKHKNKYSFYKLSRKYNLDELRDFYVSNFLENEVKWVGDLTGPDGEKNFKEWQKRNQALTYRFESDIVFLLDRYNTEEWLKVKDGQYPVLLSHLMKGDVSIETVVIMNELMNFIPMWQSKIQDDVVWPNWDMKIRKYSPFVHFDKRKYRTLLRDKINEIS